MKSRQEKNTPPKILDTDLEMDNRLAGEGKSIAKGRSGDRRVERTRRMLRDALFSLIEEHGYDTLTIQDITERANIGRATFYVHYKDKEQLLIANLQTIMEDLRSQFTSISALDILVKRQTLSVLVFQHVFEHAPLYRALLSERGAALSSTYLRVDMATYLRQLIIEQFLAMATFELPADMLTEYTAASLLSLVNWWLKHDFPKSVEEMGDIFWQLINQGLIKTLGLPEYKDTDQVHP